MNSKPPLRSMVHRSCHRISPFRIRCASRVTDDIICRRIPPRTRTSRVPMVITATGLSTSVAQTYICYTSSPPTVGTSSSTVSLLLLNKSLTLSSPRLILVDSTRAGKRLPDALSKTVPIWCAVINRATRLRGLLKRRTAKDTDTDGGQAEEEEAWDAAADLRTPPGAVSPHEHAQIAARLDSWAATLAVRHIRAPFHRAP